MVVMPALTDLTATFQDVATFLSVRADGEELEGISKYANITTFPTVVVMRGADELERFEGDVKLVENVIRCISSLATDDDKMAHAKRREAIRRQKILDSGVDLYEEESVEEGPLEWTWDSEKGGELMDIVEDGMRVVLKNKDDEVTATWEKTKERQGEWTPVTTAINLQIETAYKGGHLYKNRRYGLKDVEVQQHDKIEIGNYFVNGFIVHEKLTGDGFHLRRRGERLSVPFEDKFLTPDQKNRDAAMAHWRKQNEEWRLKMKEARYGKDCEAIRGSIGIIPNNGLHTWTLRWEHEPARGGRCDGVGLCSDNCEKFGPGPAPFLGSSGDQGASLAVYATGEVYHNGSKIAEAHGSRSAAEASDSTAGGRSALFGKGSVLTCVFDTVADGGTLRISVDSVPVDVVITGVYDLLGAEEIYPCVCMCPLDPVLAPLKVEGNQADLAAAADVEMKKNDSDFEEDDDYYEEDDDYYEDDDDDDDYDGRRRGRRPSRAAPPGEDGEKDDHEDEEDITRNLPCVTLIPQSELRLAELVAAAAAAAVASDDVTVDSVTPTATAADEVEENETGADSDEASSASSKLKLASSQLVEERDTGAEKLAVSSEGEKGEGDTDTTVKQEVKEDKPNKKEKRKGKVNSSLVQWMHESGDGWIPFSKDISSLLEGSHSKGRHELSLTLPTGLCKFDLAKLTQKYEGTGDTKRLRRHVMKDTVEDLWEMLSLKYEKPFGLSAQSVLKLLEKVWSNGESMKGGKVGLGFLFLYSLLSGEVRFKIIRAGGWGGDYGGGGYGAYGGGYGGYGGGEVAVGGYGGYGGTVYGATTGFGSTSANDAHRFALLMTQLFSDRESKSLTSSVINVLCRNRQVSLRMPKFKDTRKRTSGSNIFNGWVDAEEPRSPVAELFSKVVPLMRSMKRKGAFHFPPPAPFDELPKPPTTCAVSASREIELQRDLRRPQLSDYGCDNRLFAAVSPDVIHDMARAVKHRFDSDVLRPQPPLVVEDDDHFVALTQSLPDQLLVVYFFASWCRPCKALAPVFHQLSLRIPTARFIKVGNKRHFLIWVCIPKC